MWHKLRLNGDAFDCLFGVEAFLSYLEVFYYSIPMKNIKIITTYYVLTVTLRL
ncbi:MAG: hypothetical protein NZT61_04020 [Deltaproteobacteria bacterium]|nr:hypothetical protein [Deltaproteobacteria bacterium]